MKFLKVIGISNLLLLFVSNVFADMQDPIQNSGSNNYSYDVKSKWYVGVDYGHGFFTNKTISFNNKNNTIENNAANLGGFFGYKYNSYFSFELDFNHIGTLKNTTNFEFPFNYRADVYNVGVDGLVSYPIISSYSCTTSLYAKGGYGMDFTNYNYNLNNGINSASGNLDHGVYNFGLGLNFDFQTNMSVRLDYTYSQVYYPMIFTSNNQNANVIAVGIYYNFL